MKMLWAKLFCRHLFWMVIWFLTLHMEDLTWGLAALFTCPNVFWGFGFSKQTSFCRCIFLSLQLTLPSKEFWERVKWDSLQHKEWHNTVGTQNWEHWGECETFLQVSFSGIGRMGQLCSLDEGCSARHCRHFSCFILPWALCWAWSVWWKLMSSRPGPGNEKCCPGITGTWARKAVKAPFCSWREILAAWCPPPLSASVKADPNYPWKANPEAIQCRWHEERALCP